MSHFHFKSGKILLITKELMCNPTGGRELLCTLNYDSLNAIYSSRIMLFELIKAPQNDLKRSVGAFRGHIDGVSKLSLVSALKLIATSTITSVFVDGSNLGVLVAATKKQFPDIRITTFFHNVEARFFWGSLKQKKSIHALGVLIANYIAERKSVKYSDQIICLNTRDSELVKRIYGRGATHIAPMVLHDQCPDIAQQDHTKKPEKFALFVGGTFYANVAGIQWYVREVIPRIDVPLYIVGRGFEAYREQFEIPGKVIVVGAVEHLAEWYQRAQFVVAPIFDGSGMKTKVAEALMYGKKIIGTPEAFTGYEAWISHTGWLCDNADEFIDAIAKAQVDIKQSFYPSLRKLYEEHYSISVGQKRLKKILLEI